jgi:hypothetical protein
MAAVPVRVVVTDVQGYEAVGDHTGYSEGCLPEYSALQRTFTVDNTQALVGICIPYYPASPIQNMGPRIRYKPSMYLPVSPHLGTPQKPLTTAQAQAQAHPFTLSAKKQQQCHYRAIINLTLLQKRTYRTHQITGRLCVGPLRRRVKRQRTG